MNDRAIGDARTRTATIPLGVFVGVVLVGANLRASLTGIGALLPLIQHDTGLDSTAAGLIAALPLLGFAATSPLVRPAVRMLGGGRLLILALGVMVVGTALRSVPGTVSLFLGTVVLAIGIAVCNVLLPSIVKASVAPAQIGRVTGLYVTVMGAVAAVSSGIAVPLADILPGGWRSSLAVWAILAVVALIVVVSSRFASTVPAERGPQASGASVRVWRSGLAWQVSLFMGLQSIVFYTMISWLPSIVAASGTDAGTAGWQLFAFQIAGLATSSIVPILTRHHRDHRAVAAAASLLCAVGFAMLLLDPQAAWIAALLIGFGGGACIVLALSFQTLRAPDAAAAGALAGMAQTVGYLLAAAAPFVLGAIHDLTQSWTAPLLLLVVLGVLQAVTALGAGRDRVLATDRLTLSGASSTVAAPTTSTASREGRS